MKNQYQELEEEAKKAIDAAINEDGDCLVITTIDGFRTDQEAKHLRDMLWYARDMGVVISFVPKETKL